MLAEVAHVCVGCSEGCSVGCSDGSSEGSSVGSSVGCSVGSSVGCSDGSSGGCSDGSSVGSSVGSSDGSSVGSFDGSSVPGLHAPCRASGRPGSERGRTALRTTLSDHPTGLDTPQELFRIIPLGWPHPGERGGPPRPHSRSLAVHMALHC